MLHALMNRLVDRFGRTGFAALSSIIWALPMAAWAGSADLSPIDKTATPTIALTIGFVMLAVWLVLLTQLGRAARSNGDDLTWLLTSFLDVDSRRRGRWSRALADLAVAQRPDNQDVLAKWVGRWAARADEAALGLGTILEAAAGIPAAQVAAHARTAREQFLAGLLETAGESGAAQAG